MARGDVTSLDAIARETREAEEIRREALLRLEGDGAGALARGTADLARSSRILAVLGVLGSADLDGFHEHLATAASARRRLFACVAKGAKVLDPSLLSAAPALDEALAAGYGALAIGIANEAPSSAMGGPEGARGEALRALVLAKDDAARAVAAFARAAPSRALEASAMIAIARADRAAFDEALEAIVAARRSPSFTPLHAGERWLFVDLIGLVRLASWRGVSTLVRDAGILPELSATPRREPKDVLPPIPERFIDDRGAL